MRRPAIGALPPWLRRAGRWAFRLAAILALVYVLRAMTTQWQAIADWRPGPGAIAILVATIPLYGSSLFLLAEMWHRLVSAFHGAVLSRRLTWPSYTTTQIAKYLPGNVFHLVGRHVWLADGGVGHRPLGTALAGEIALLLAGAGLVASAGLVAVPTAAAALPIPAARALAALALTLAALAVAAALLAPRHPALTAWRPHAVAGLAALALSMLFFLGQAGIFLAICHAVTGQAIAAAGVAAVIAWIAGFVIPGAPGGLGMREIVLLLMLTPAMAEPDALIAIALFRGVTICGDLVCFAMGRLIRRPSRVATGA